MTQSPLNIVVFGKHSVQVEIDKLGDYWILPQPKYHQIYSVLTFSFQDILEIL